MTTQKVTNHQATTTDVNSNESGKDLRIRAEAELVVSTPVVDGRRRTVLTVRKQTAIMAGVRKKATPTRNDETRTSRGAASMGNAVLTARAT
ncbi:MAG: hypothetical protein P8J37_04865 [Fuerstiella sp.]|nr:hypothetical protein [Fuerstiella sp.]